jgi:hypothetical protein
MKKVFFVLFFFTVLGAVGVGQSVPETMKFINPINTADSNSIGVSYNTLSYFRDYEYFKNKIQTGYTFFGTWHYPRLVIQPSPRLRLEAGVLVQKEFGDRHAQDARVMFSLQFMPVKNTRIIFGALEGTLSHNLVQPLMDWDRIIERPIEEGFQIRHNSNHFDVDLWLDWSLRQTVNSNFPEELTGGLSFAYKLTKPGKPWQVKIPVQFVTPHKGGQLDTNHSIVTTVLNSAAGINAEWKEENTKKFIKHFSADIYHVGYKHFHKSNLYPFDNGSGILANVLAKSKTDIGVALTYWNGDQFIAPLGAPIYQSISSILPKYAGYSEKERNLLLINLFYEKELFKNFYTYASVYPYVDLKNGYLEHSFLIMFSYKNNFRLGKLRK